MQSSENMFKESYWVLSHNSKNCFFARRVSFLLCKVTADKKESNCEVLKGIFERKVFLKLHFKDSSNDEFFKAPLKDSREFIQSSPMAVLDP